MDKFQTYQMPTGPVYDKRAKLFATLQKDERYHYAKSCKHCTDTADSFNRYVSTYCHARQENIAGGMENKLGRCAGCERYQAR